MSADRTGQDRGGRSVEAAHRREQAARLVARARDAAGVSADLLGMEAGVSPSRVYAWGDPDRADGAPVPLHAAMCPAIARHVVGLLAERIGCVVVELPRAAGGADDLRLLADVQRECTDTVTEFLSAISDGTVDRRENAAVRAKARAAAAALSALIHVLEATADEPARPVRIAR